MNIPTPEGIPEFGTVDPSRAFLGVACLLPRYKGIKAKGMPSLSCSKFVCFYDRVKRSLNRQIYMIINIVLGFLCVALTLWMINKPKRAEVQKPRPCSFYDLLSGFIGSPVPFFWWTKAAAN